MSSFCVFCVLCVRLSLREHIVQTLRRIDEHAQDVGATTPIDMLRLSADLGANDARWLRETYARERLLGEVVRQASLRFRG